jgi:phosphate transport system substrate-binding protein
MAFQTKKYAVMAAVAFVATAGILFSCNQEKDAKGNVISAETMTSGTITMMVDESVQPIIEDVLAVFLKVYGKAHINQVNSTENEIVNALLKDAVTTVIMARPLTKEEETHFTKTGVTPEVTHFATDALAVIAAGKPADSTITVDELYKVLRGESVSGVNKLVLDNPNSGTVHYLMQQAGVKELPVKNIVYQKNSAEVIKFVSNNAGTIGVVGVNWLLQPTPDVEKSVENLTVFGVQNVKVNKPDNYFTPTQSNIAEGFYPLTRKLYVLNYQGKKGLGIGFANYIRATQGQRIILKSGLLPQEIPTRQLEVRNEL